MANKKLQRDSRLKLAQKVGDRAVGLQTSSSSHLNKYLTKRADRIVGVRRFIASWLVLLVIIFIAGLTTWRQLYTSSRTTIAEAGGTYTEGILGSVNSLNPLFASGAVDESAVKLTFNGLLQYDDDNQLVGDLASEWKVDDTRKAYTVRLRQDVRWQDGQPFEAADVLYTVQAIQNPEVRSSLFASWQGIKVTSTGRYDVRFELPGPFAPFPNSLTLPILPKHLLEDIAPKNLRTASFNLAPVGTGPFVFQALRSPQPRQQQVEFRRNNQYHRSAPKIDRFVIHSYEEEAAIVRALEEREITAAVDLKADSLRVFDSDPSIRVIDIPLNSGVFAFFKTTMPPLSSTEVRTALASAINRQAMLKLFDSRYAPLKTPLLPGQLGFDARYQQQTNIAQAETMLDQAGWKKQVDGKRAKDGATLQLNLLTVNSPEYGAVASELQKQWAKVGVTIKPQLLTAEQLQQNALNTHAYDILLYGVSIGSDPDVYAYWHSSQARAGGVNFSEWQSGRADASLEVARTRLEPVLRVARYQTFLDEWQKLAPATALYQPEVSYVYHQNANGIRHLNVSSAADRLGNVETWTVNTKTVKISP